MKKIFIVLAAFSSLSVFADCNIEFVTLGKNISTQQIPQQQLQHKFAAKNNEDQTLFFSKSASLKECVSEYEKIAEHAAAYPRPGCNIEQVQMRFDYGETPLVSWQYIKQCQQQHQNRQ